MAKPESERPAGCRFWLASDVVSWIGTHTKLNTKLKPDYDPEVAAIWWLANILSEGYADMSRRELAEMVRDGIPALTIDDVTDYVQAAHEDAESTPAYIEELDDQTEYNLRDFFNL